MFFLIKHGIFISPALFIGALFFAKIYPNNLNFWAFIISLLFIIYFSYGRGYMDGYVDHFDMMIKSIWNNCVGKDEEKGEDTLDKP